MDLHESIVNQTDVSLLLAKHVISAHGEDGNLVFSPLSMHVVLSLTAAGSGGPTKDQLLGFLRSESTQQLDSLFSETVSRVLADGSPSGGPRLSCANGAWVDLTSPLNPPFKQIAANTYRAFVENADFKNKAEEEREKVNMWAEKETNGLIKEILPKGSPTKLTRLMLANAVYFKGIWSARFYDSATKDREFFLSDGNSVRVPFMTSYQNQYMRVFNGFKVLRLPYQQGEDQRSFSMCIYLPDDKDGLPSLMKKMSSESGFIERHIPRQLEELDDFRVPKFQITFDFEASQVLKEMGLELPFDEIVCGLTEMVNFKSGKDEGLYVSRIFHKAFIEVNEEGAVAAAVTVESDEEMGYSMYVEEKVKLDFVADHPFLFVIREDTTGVVLFVGQVLNPIGGI